MSALEKGQYGNGQPPAMYKIMMAQQIEVTWDNKGRSSKGSMSFCAVLAKNIGHVSTHNLLLDSGNLFVDLILLCIVFGLVRLGQLSTGLLVASGLCTAAGISGRLGSSGLERRGGRRHLKGTG